MSRNNQVKQWGAAEDDFMAPEVGVVESFLGNPFSSPEEDEEWEKIERRMDVIGQNGNGAEHYDAPPLELNKKFDTDRLAKLMLGLTGDGGKQPRYQDATGEDWIDEAARTFTAEEFRGAMRFSIGKYNRRMGKKDELIKEIEKMRDYCDRWLEVEVGR